MRVFSIRLFGTILLDRTACFIARCFGRPNTGRIDSHRKLDKKLASYAAEKDLAGGAAKRISRSRVADTLGLPAGRIAGGLADIAGREIDPAVLEIASQTAPVAGHLIPAEPVLGALGRAGRRNHAD
jgi:hypothetical protein